MLKAHVAGLCLNTGMIFTAERATLQRNFSGGRRDAEFDHNSRRAEREREKIRQRKVTVSSGFNLSDWSKHIESPLPKEAHSWSWRQIIVKTQRIFSEKAKLISLKFYCLLNKALDINYTLQNIIPKVHFFFLSLYFRLSPTHSVCFSLWNDFEMFSSGITVYIANCTPFHRLPISNNK